ncbi:hypothetical protein MLD38_006100 [Melastoma candidum]|uniref:Uncharacterized protein n=1 Tax=Melastoma candidum TaxID=119954 RepID=A0ACB9RLU3_9MYRT|nr:hypothetical protein MLD38_006100 [Melastoma candidum]
MEGDELVSDVFRDRFRVSSVCICESEARKSGMEISECATACISDLAYKFSEQLAKDIRLFAHHARRKTVKTEDILISTHRNEHLTASLRSFWEDLNAKEPQSDRKKRRKPPKEEEEDEEDDNRAASIDNT